MTPPPPLAIFRGHNSLASHLYIVQDYRYIVFEVSSENANYTLYIYIPVIYLYISRPDLYISDPPPLESMLDPPNRKVFYVHCGLGVYKIVFTNIKYWEYYPRALTTFVVFSGGFFANF